MDIGSAKKEERGPGRHFLKWTRLQAHGSNGVQALSHAWSVYCVLGTPPGPAGAARMKEDGSRAPDPCRGLGTSWPSCLLPHGSKKRPRRSVPHLSHRPCRWVGTVSLVLTCSKWQADMVGAGWGARAQTLHPHFPLQALATPVP